MKVTKNLLDLVRQNYVSLHELSSHLASRGYRTSDVDVAKDTAQAVYDVFETIAWSDRRLHAAECWLLDALLEEDMGYGEHLPRAIAAQRERTPGTFRVPGCVLAAAKHDADRGSRFQQMLIHHLENIALLVAMADELVTAEELRSIESYFGQLRVVTVPPDRPTLL